MSEGDFEVMPIGTMKELRILRQFANEMIKLREEGLLPDSVMFKVAAIETFYAEHNSEYPV